MFNPACLVADALLAFALFWNDLVDRTGLGFLAIEDGRIEPVFDLFLWLCGFQTF